MKQTQFEIFDMDQFIYFAKDNCIVKINFLMQNLMTDDNYIMMKNDTNYDNQLRKLESEMFFECIKGYNYFYFYKKNENDFFKRELIKLKNILVIITNL